MLLFKEECYKIIGRCFSVHSNLGFGFHESVYHEALIKEFESYQIPYKHEAKIEIEYKEEKLEKKYYADFCCYDKILLEIKACAHINEEHVKQVLNYLAATKLKLGIIINFGEKSLKFKRVIFDK